jgi:hypothetical protein
MTAGRLKQQNPNPKNFDAAAHIIPVMDDRESGKFQIRSYFENKAGFQAFRTRQIYSRVSGNGGTP